MEFEGYDISRRGQCLICGTRLMVGEICSDCHKANETKRELWGRVCQANPVESGEIYDEVERSVAKEQSVLIEFG